MIRINGKFYYFDLEKISEFINYSDEHSTIDTQKTDEIGFEDGSPIPSTKTITEFNTHDNRQLDGLRYDMVRSFFSLILSYEGSDDFEDFPIGMKLAINTMIAHRFLVETRPSKNE